MSVDQCERATASASSKSALITLVDELRSTDTVSIVAYNRNAWVILSPTQAWNRDMIINAIDELEPGGSTNAEAGLTLGYDLAEETFVAGNINRGRACFQTA